MASLMLVRKQSKASITTTDHKWLEKAEDN